MQCIKNISRQNKFIWVWLSGIYPANEHATFWKHGNAQINKQVWVALNSIQQWEEQQINVLSLSGSDCLSLTAGQNDTQTRLKRED